MIFVIIIFKKIFWSLKYKNFKSENEKSKIKILFFNSFLKENMAV